jgi:ketosteroid isomerase-like protein
MKPVAGVAISLVIVLQSACAAAATDNAADVAALRQADSAYSASLKALDAAGAASHYADDASGYPPNGPTVTGGEGFRQYAAAFMAAPGLSISPAPGNTVVVAQSGDLGYTVTMVHATFKDSLGNATEEPLRDLHIWRKDAAGNWKIIYDIWNSERPLAAPAH